MQRTARLRGLPLFGLAALGLVLGHALSYVIAVPDPHHRDLVLRETGHSYLPVAGELAVLLAFAGLVVVLVRAVGAESRHDEPNTPPTGLLVAIQVAAFLGQEVIERLIAGAPLAGLASDHLIVIGVLVQILVATLGALVLRWLARAATRIAALLEPRPALPQPVAVASLVIEVVGPSARVRLTPATVRGPPSA